MQDSGCIYGLFDPRTNELRYVGLARSAPKRLQEHLGRATRGIKSHVCDWLRQVLAAGGSPVQRMLEVDIPVERLAERERFWIQHYRSAGARLTNLTDGGEGNFGWVPSAETKARISAALSGRPLSTETRQKLSAVHSARVRKPMQAIYCEKMSVARKGQKHAPHSAETRQKISASTLGRVVTEATRTKLSQAMMGKPISERCRSRSSECHKGKKQSPEQVAARVASTKATMLRKRGLYGNS